MGVTIPSSPPPTGPTGPGNFFTNGLHALTRLVSKIFSSPTPSPKKISPSLYPLMHEHKRTEREMVFETMAKASKDAFLEIGAIPSTAPQGVGNEEYKKFCAIVHKLQTVLDSPHTNHRKAIEQATLLIRQAEGTAAYKKLCDDESLPAIKYLHRIVLASFVDFRPVMFFDRIKNALTPEGGFKQQDAAGRIGEMRERGIAGGLIENDLSVQYIVRFLHCSITALRSERLFSWLGLYDPYLGAENFRGTAYELEVRSGQKMRGIITCCPTVGDEVAPEARILLHALRNRKRMSQEDLRKDPYPITSWGYQSFQNLKAHNEGARALAIMRLNEEFPDVFMGITFSLDSEFMLDDVRGKNEKSNEQRMIERGETGVTHAYSRQMYNEIIINREQFSFPRGTKDWSDDLLKIVEEAAAKVGISEEKATNDEQKKANWEKKAAFRELVTLGVVRYWQYKSMLDRGDGLVSCVCKENIDRGGQVNAAILWAMGQEDDAHKLLLGRALMVRFRLVLQWRTKPLDALLKHVTQEKAHDFLQLVQGVAMPKGLFPA